MTLEEIKAACDIAWQEKFLELAGLKIGDEVTCLFTTYHGDRKHCSMGSALGKGTIIRTEEGIFVQSYDRYIVARNTKKYPNRPYNYETYWKYTEETVLSDLKYIRLNSIK